MSTTVASAMPAAVAATMSCAAATVYCRAPTAMHHAFSADMSRAPRTASHAMLTPGVSIIETDTVSCDTSCASSADVPNAGPVAMFPAGVDSVGQGAMIVMPGVVDRPVV